MKCSAVGVDYRTPMREALGSRHNSLRTRSFSEHRFVPENLNRKDIVKIFSGNLEGFLVQPLFLSLLGYKSQSSFSFS